METTIQDFASDFGCYGRIQASRLWLFKVSRSISFLVANTFAASSVYIQGGCAKNLLLHLLEATRMKKTMLSLTILVLGCLSIVQPASAQEKRGRNTTISTDGEKRITDCEQVRMQIGDVDAIRSQLTQTVPQSAFSTLHVRAPRNGGIHVQGWNRNEYSITACLAVAGDNANEAKGILDQLKLSIADGQVAVEGPTPQDWLAYLIIQAPNGAALDLTSGNGPIGVTEFAGTVKARNQNGPISFYDVNGQVRADVQNGPITVRGGGGDFRLTAQNGP